MPDTPLQFAIIGCGTIGPTHAQALTALQPEGARLSAFADEVPARAEALAAQFGAKAQTFEAILADPAIDAVTICVPSGLHAELGARALRAGKTRRGRKADGHLAGGLRRTAGPHSRHRVSAWRSSPSIGSDHASIEVKAALENGILGKMVYAEARVSLVSHPGVL